VIEQREGAADGAAGQQVAGLGWYCDASDETIHTGADMKVSDRMLNRLKARAEGLLAPDEIRRIRKTLGLTQEQAGELIGGGPRAFQKALRGAAALGFGRAEIVATLQTMRRPHFHKSMTALGNHRAWQDVYHVPSSAGLLYVKFTADAVTQFLLMSFKEKAD
jgi:motility quorum-sensing regulator/GCU-specific mRNA interferase toxin